MASLTEDDLIARYFAPLATDAGAAGLRDDAAMIVPPPGHALVVTVDALVAGQHFLDDPPESIARKALRVNLSDLAAKGARPLGYLLTLALPIGWREEWLAAFARGLRDDGERFGLALLGGDTVKTTGPLTVSVTAFGVVPGVAIPRRFNAGPGEAIYVSGTIGEGALGLLARRDDHRLDGLSPAHHAALVQRYREPDPRVTLAEAVRCFASASMDVSDGLVGDCAKLLRVSGIAGSIEQDAVPLSAAARAAIALDPGLIDIVLTGGDDYEILCTVAAANEMDFRAAAAVAGVPVSRIGSTGRGAGLDVRGPDGHLRSFARESYSHF